MIAIPSIITLIGLMLGLLGVALWPSPLGCALLVASLALDVVDGTVARRWRWETAFGRHLDWTSDVTIGALLLAHLSPLFGAMPIVIVVIWQAAAQALEVKVSGRAAVTITAICVAMSPAFTIY